MKTITPDQLTPELAAQGCAVVGMSNEDYHAYPAYSKSGLDLIDRSPYHYHLRTPKKATRPMEIGTAIHCAILEPERFAKEYMLLRDVTDRRQSEYKEAVKVYGSERTLSGPEADKVSTMQETVLSRHQGLSDPDYTELSLFAKCPKTGLMIKARLDWIKAGLAIDLKKTQDVRPFELAKSITNYRYHVQDRFYSYVYKLATGESLKDFIFLFVEEEFPHATVLAPLDSLAREVGEYKMWKNMETVVDCESDNHWPQPESPEELSITNWALSQYEDELEVGIDDE